MPGCPLHARPPPARALTRTQTANFGSQDSTQPTGRERNPCPPMAGRRWRLHSHPTPSLPPRQRGRPGSRAGAGPSSDRAVQSRSSELARSLCLTESGRFPLRLPAGFPASYPQRDERFLPVGTRFPPISHQRPRAPSQGVWPSVFCHVVLRKS